MKILFLLFLATFSCPCELTGHRFCGHQEHVFLQKRTDIRKLRKTNLTSQEIIKSDTIAISNSK